MNVLAALLSYFCGAIPFGILVGRARGVDVTSVGSGNIGATNVWRTLGPAAGTLVFVLDVGKGFAAPLLARTMVGPSEYSLIAICALVAVLGHTFSVFLKFRGGKGIATAFGALLGLNPLLALALFAVWGMILVLSRTISIASILVAFAAPIVFFVAKQPTAFTLVVALFAAVAITKHFPNMKRIASGTEPKIGARKIAPSPTSDATTVELQ